MKYAIISHKGKDGKHSIERLLDINEAVNSVAQLQALPAFSDETLDFTWAQVITVPADVDVDSTKLYNATTGTFEDAPPQRNPIITKLQLLRLLNQQEKALLFAPQTVPDLPQEAQVLLTIFAQEIKVATEINLDDAGLVQGLGYLEQNGLIAAGRANAIRGVSA